MKTLTIKITVSDPSEMEAVKALGPRLRYLFSDALYEFRMNRKHYAQTYVEDRYPSLDEDRKSKKIAEVNKRLLASAALHNPALSMEVSEGDDGVEP